MTGPTRLYLLRHGEVERAYHGVFNGRLEMDLSPRGVEQATLLANYLKAVPLDAIYASPMRRVQQTLAPLAAATGLVAQTRAELVEVDFGAWAGLNLDQVRARFGVNPYDWLIELERGGIPNAEDGPRIRARLEPCVREMLQRHPGQSVAVLCHGGVIRAILGLLLELPLGKTNLFHIEYASVTEVHLHPERTRLQLLDFTPWRDLPA